LELGDTFEIFLRPEDQLGYVEFHVTPTTSGCSCGSRMAGALETRKKYRFDPGAPHPGRSLSLATWVKPEAQRWFVYAEIPSGSVCDVSKPLAGKPVAVLLQPLRLHAMAVMEPVIPPLTSCRTEFPSACTSGVYRLLAMNLPFMNPYYQFVSGIAESSISGRSLPLGGIPRARQTRARRRRARRAHLFAHPDDECIIGGFCLAPDARNGAAHHHVAVTQGKQQGSSTGTLPRNSPTPAAGWDSA